MVQYPLKSAAKTSPAETRGSIRLPSHGAFANRSYRRSSPILIRSEIPEVIRFCSKPEDIALAGWISSFSGALGEFEPLDLCNTRLPSPSTRDSAAAVRDSQLCAKRRGQD